MPLPAKLVCLAALVVCVASPAERTEHSPWDREKAFAFLEARQQAWAAWKPAQKFGGACISCHTGMSYLAARRIVNQGEQRGTAEQEMVQAVITRALANPPQPALQDPGVEAILNLWVLSLQRRRANDPLTEADRAALKRLAELQTAEGAWSWFNFDLHPVESEHSKFYGATLANAALSAYPREAAAPSLSALQTYLQREAPKQPLHNRLAWMADKTTRKQTLADLWRAQSPDGGWTTASLGPWAPHPEAPADNGSNAYATAWAAHAARQAGVSCTDAQFVKALRWLAAKQDRATGAWPAPSLNKVYEKGSIQAGFMTDMASGFAAAALASCTTAH